MKRFLTIAIAFAVLTSLFSCAPSTKTDGFGNDTSVNTDDTSQDELETTSDDSQFDPGLPERDFGGVPLRILNISPDDTFWWSTTAVDAEEESGDVVNDAIYLRNRAIEAKYNTKIEVVCKPDAMLLPTVAAMVSAGTNEFEIITPPIDKAAAMAQAGYLRNLRDVEHLDFSKSWWNQTTLDNFSISNKLYFATGDFILSDNDSVTIMMYNKRLAKDLNAPDAEAMYDLVMSGGWTMDKMFEYAALAPADLDGNGKKSFGDRFGLAACQWVQAAFMGAFGQTLTSKDDKDIPIFSAGGEKFVEGFEKTNLYLANKELVVLEYADFQDIQLGDLVMNDYALFTAADLSCVRLYRAMESDFAILPFPKLNQEQDRYYSFCVTSTSIAVPVTNDKTEMTGLLMEALTAESSRIVIPAYYEQAIAKKYLRDDKSFQILDIIMENPVCDVLYWVYNWGDFATSFDNLMRKSNANITSAVDKSRAKVEAAIQKTVDAYDSLP